MNLKRIHTQDGMSLIEVLLAASIFGLISTTLVGIYAVGLHSTQNYSDTNEAILLVDEGIEAIRAIRDDAFNELSFNQSGVTSGGGTWEILGESTTDTIGNYTRQVVFTDVCRDAIDDVVACPGTYTDIHSKRLTVTVSWIDIYSRDMSVVRETIITNWSSINWMQMDWSGGEGQDIWSDASMYESDNGAIDTSGPEISLAHNTATSCGTNWSFDSPVNYTYDMQAIEIIGGSASLKGSGGNGMFSGGVVDSFEYDTQKAVDSDTAHISGNVFAVVYEGQSDVGWVKTVTVSSDGQIGDSAIDLLKYDSGKAKNPKILHIEGEVYAVVYEGDNDDGWVNTFRIQSDGQIDDSLIDSYEFDSSKVSDVDLVHISGDIFGIAYRGDDVGTIKTVTIQSDGQIGTSVIDTLEFDTSKGKEPEILNISGDVYAIVYEADGDDGTLKTVTIQSNGQIVDSIIDTFVFDSNKGKTPEITHISGDVYAIAYEADGDDGMIVTVTIQANGQISNSTIDNLEFDTSKAQDADIIGIGGDYYVVVYEGKDSDGWAKTFIIQSDGSISNSVVDSFEFDNDKGKSPDVISVSENAYAISYQGDNDDGYLVTFNANASSYSSSGPTIHPTSAQNPSGIGSWSTFTETSTKNGGEIYYQLSNEDGTNWKYWDGESWTIASSTDYNTAAEVSSNISLFPTTGGLVFQAFLSGDGTQQVVLSDVQVECTGDSRNFQMEVGTVSADENWVIVNLQNTYTSPIVATSLHYSNNTIPATVRLKNVGTTSFEVKLQAPDGTNLSSDEVTYWVVEEGVWDMNGVPIEAAKYDTSTVAWKNSWTWDIQSYSQTFSSDTLVFHQVQTENDSSWITTMATRYNSRTNPPQSTSTGIALNGAHVTSSHGSETIGYIVVPVDVTGDINGTDFEFNRTGDTIRGYGTCYTDNYLGSYGSSKKVGVAGQEMDGSDGGWAQVCSIGTTNSGFHFDEDTVGDSERNHTTETVGYFVFDSEFDYSEGGSGSGDAYELSGYLVSSAFDTGDAGNSVQVIGWSETVPSCSPSCEVRLQVRSAPDNSGSPGSWTSWYGANGAGTYFTTAAGNLISADLNNNQWIQYRVEFVGDGSDTPVLTDVYLNYQ